MSKIIFNEHQIRQLELNPNVASNPTEPLFGKTIGHTCSRDGNQGEERL